MVNEEEGRAMAELLIRAMKDSSTKGIVLNNREAKGAWPEKMAAPKAARLQQCK